MQLLLPIIIFIVFLITIHFSKKLKLFDIPNDRKSHSAPVVFTGGLAISLSFIIIIILTNIETSYSKILIFSIPIMILGFIDDLIDIKASIRLIIQISISTLLILHSDLIINNLGYYFHIPLELGSLSIFFTIACVLTIINSLNYFDGLHGLASIIFITTILNIILINLFFMNIFVYDFILVILPISIFLIFNLRVFKMPRLFLGDNGSNMLGFILAFLTIHLVQENNNYINHYNIIWIFGLLVFEFLSTTLSRIIENKGIFEPGKDHIHYMILKKSKSKLTTVLLITLINEVILIFGIIFSTFIKDFNLIAFILFFVFYFYLRNKFLKNI